MAASERNATDSTFGLPDLSCLTETERMQVMAVMQRAKDFEFEEEKKMTMSPRKPMEGQLYKYTNVMKGWQYRWFMLDPESGVLEYFEKEEHKKQRPRGSIHLAASVISPTDEDSQTFTVNAANGDVYRLRASDARERQHWVDRLRATAEYHTATIAQYSSPVVKKEATPGSVKEATPIKLGYRPHSDSHENINAAVVVSRSQHKQTVNPDLPDSLREVKEFLAEVEDYSGNLSEKIEALPKSGEYLTGLDKNLLLLKATSAATMQCLHQCLHILHTKQAIINHNPLPLGTPSKARSYSGIRRTSSQTSAPSTAESYCSAGSAPPLPVNIIDQKRDAVMGIKDDINHDDEVLDEKEYQDSDLDGVEEHKSIILHLLSQLKLGMDLTKVVLPTFILERRSLLEMFADCMAHPDLFLKITEKSTPEDRMLTVLEWYLTSFHAGRQGSVAKKPYNPIIGETFHCSWDIPQKGEEKGNGEGGKTGDENKEADRLIYCAEQVSHHPPVSAFYFECPSRRVCMNASIWTKSKFMGMSIGVVMVGKVRLYLQDYGEEYTFTLPSAYARSILTVPWVEMGDKVTISCPQTNYTSSVVFHTKPFYGGKLHRVTAEVKNGETGDIACKVQGEWNANLDFTYANGETKSVDVQKLPVWRKRVRPIKLQNDNESRKLWQHVTNALSMGDVETATEHKRCLEDRQREGEKHRRDTHTTFPTKLFQKVEDTWVYKHPLAPQLKKPS